MNYLQKILSLLLAVSFLYTPIFSIHATDWKLDSSSEQRKFASHEYDSDTGLSYMNARYYNGKAGRFVSQDPAFLAVGDRNRIKSITNQELQAYLSDPQGFNSYSYARNNPLVYIDETGEFAFLAPAISAVYN